MEKFYTVNEGSKLYDDYWAWRNSIASNKKIVDDFFKEFGIEADLYCPNSTVIGIVPTDNDRIKFAKQLCTKESNEGLRFFKKNSAINKEWVKRAVNLRMYINLLLHGLTILWAKVQADCLIVMVFFIVRLVPIRLKCQ